MTGRRYAVVSPCRDEEDFVATTLAAVAAQTEVPACWVVVDDGSSDATPQILSDFADEHPWMRVLTLAPRATRVLGPAVVHAFDAGVDTLDLDDYDYVVKLDMDLDLPTTYFADLMDAMEADPRLASASGTPCRRLPDGSLVPERGSAEMSAGMSKFYRVRAFRDMGGFVPVLMWDGIDCHTTRIKGWRARMITDERLRFAHLRQMGSSDRGILRGKRRHGRGQYLMGTHPLFFTAAVAARLRDEPRIIGGLHTLAGYVGAALRREPRSQGPEFRAQVRRFQLETLAFGKQRAVRRWEGRQAPVWNPPGGVASGDAGADAAPRRPRGTGGPRSGRTVRRVSRSS